MRALLTLLLAPLPALGQERIPSHCVALSQGPERVMPAAWSDPVPQDAVRISYLGHAMLLLQAGEVAAVTDYTGFIGDVGLVPDVVTMNNSHATHWTPFPDPAIPHVLRGWAEGGVAPRHHLDLGALLVRNVATDTRAGQGAMGQGAVRPDGNSIFVFEAGGLCIGHLGHLHHEPTPEDYALLGRLDVAMVPVDGGLTLDHPTLMRVLDRLRSRVVIPMHWFGPGTLDAFLAGLSADFAVEEVGGAEVTLTLAGLPDRRTVVVLRPVLLAD